MGADATEANADSPGSEGGTVLDPTKLLLPPLPLSPRSSRDEGGGSVFDGGVDVDGEAPWARSVGEGR